MVDVDEAITGAIAEGQQVRFIKGSIAGLWKAGDYAKASRARSASDQNVTVIFGGRTYHVDRCEIARVGLRGRDANAVWIDEMETPRDKRAREYAALQAQIKAEMNIRRQELADAENADWGQF